MVDPEILLGLHNSNQNKNSLELQREILAMQKLQVLNQVRMSQGLPPLAVLPQPPQYVRGKSAPLDSTFERVILVILFVAIFGIVIGCILTAS